MKRQSRNLVAEVVLVEEVNEEVVAVALVIQLVAQDDRGGEAAGGCGVVVCGWLGCVWRGGVVMW